MSLRIKILFISLLSSCFLQAQSPVLIGYWQNWNGPAPYFPLDEVDSRYDIVCVAFAMPVSDSNMEMTFVPEGVDQAAFISKIQSLQNAGKKVLLSIGGATSSITLNNIANRTAFIESILGILNTYHFDGIDIDIEHGDSILAQGTISSPTSFDCINLIYAISQIKANYTAPGNAAMLLTFAPETVYVQGGMSNYGGIWGGYLPLLDALRNEIDYVHVQLYNSGSMYGIDGTVYQPENADFIVAMTDAMIQGFQTNGGFFQGFPENKIVIGLPACPAAAGNGFIPTTIVASAVNYLKGAGPQPGNYDLTQSYPNIGGMMTWSINCDRMTSCNLTSYEYAANFEQLFASLAVHESNLAKHSIAPNPVRDKIYLEDFINDSYEIINTYGQVVKHGKVSNGQIDISDLQSGNYFLRLESDVVKFIKK